MIDNKLMCAISRIMMKYAAKANMLTDNQTSNLAECWMSFRSKFDGDKQVNRVQSGGLAYKV